MKTSFTTNSIHTVTEANINFYATPFIHPKRKMSDHDFIYMLQGEWKLGQNGEEYELKKDSLLILNAGNLHYGISPCEKSTKTMYFHVSCENGDNIIPYSNNTTNNCILLDVLTDAQNNKNIKKYFSRVVNYKLSGNQRKADLYFELLLCELSENHLYTYDTELASKIKNIIHSNPEKFYSNSELAKKLNVSVKTTETKFKQRFGITIHQYILNFKINEAISYFELYPKMSIKEIAYNLGFYDEYHFSKQFKKIKGVPPSIYKSKLSLEE